MECGVSCPRPIEKIFYFKTIQNILMTWLSGERWLPFGLLVLLTVTLRGVSNKHFLLSLFSFCLIMIDTVQIHKIILTKQIMKTFFLANSIYVIYMAIFRFGVRNSLLLAPMPTASTAQILGNNESIEAYTNNIYTRRVLSGEFQVNRIHS